jgi:hypothetical protein
MSRGAFFCTEENICAEKDYDNKDCIPKTACQEDWPEKSGDF